MNLGRSLVLALNWLHAITSLFLSKAAPTLALPLAELVQERTDFMKMKATHDLDTERRGRPCSHPPLAPAAWSFPGPWSTAPCRILCWKPSEVLGPASQAAGSPHRAPQTSGFL